MFNLVELLILKGEAIINYQLSIILTALPLGIWLYLLWFWGDFWQANCRLDGDNSLGLSQYPSVCAVVPARDEAEAIAASLTSLLNQDYAGELAIVLVDDNSSDRTSEIALETAVSLGKSDRLKVIAGQPLASGWKGKLWAMHQGIESVTTSGNPPDYWLFTDADIYHDPNNLTSLVTKAVTADVALVSLMVLLRCQSFWEKLLIPAFVFFFQLLYPFAWVNNPDVSVAAAAGGCVFIRHDALTKIGGIASIKNALIDDCTLAQAVKSSGSNIWLGLSETTISLRGYDNLKAIWDTVARTAYTQLNYSPLLLLGTILGMIIVYITAPVGMIWGLVTGSWLVFATCAMTWLLMIWAYTPTIKLYKIAGIWAGLLPAIAFLYLLMTIDSAVKYYQGQGGAWKGRIYE